MDKKRSKGVTFFGWLFVVSGIIGFLGMLNPQQHIQLYGRLIFFFSILVTMVTLVCGIFILRLSPISRKVAILLCLISIVSIPVYLKPIIKPTQAAIQPEEYYNTHKQEILKEVNQNISKRLLIIWIKQEKCTEKVCLLSLYSYARFSVCLFYY